uniref:Uncharacterized protein n=1 Tax=Brassica oleracea TaxID=3712 RepID=A0A3P6F861_BRAOL|nr:unnamed protein product [Brassica oleracea]
MLRRPVVGDDTRKVARVLSSGDTKMGPGGDFRATLQVAPALFSCENYDFSGTFWSFVCTFCTSKKPMF